MTGPPVELTNVRKSYGLFEALHGIDLVVNEGELVAVLGPNGAGKTTAIGIMLGLRKPTSGQAALFGLDPANRRARSRCGVMLQESGVADMLTARETVDLFRSYYPHPMTTERAIGLAGLQAEARQQVGKLSGGQQQRLYFALAVAGDPDVLFLDEPTVGMDVESRRGFREGIRAFSKEGKTIVLTTHYLEEADELAQRVIVIDHGLVITDAPPAEIKARVPGKRVSFSSDHVLSESEFAGLPVSRLDFNGSSVRLLSNEPEQVLAALFHRGLVIRDLVVAGADLEEAFLALTHAQPQAVAE